MEQKVFPPIPKFQFSKLLGKGVFSEVFEASKDGKRYAIKVTKKDRNHLGEDPGLALRREAAALARLNHPCLPKVIEFKEWEGLNYMVMELVEGQPLSKILEKGRLSESQIIALAQALVKGLAEIHRKGLVHRDLKPANIIVQPNLEPKIIDFGFALRANTQSQLAKDNPVVGTFAYSAPEQTGLLKRPIDGRSDLYSLGCVLFECATGRTPFLADHVGDLIQQHFVAPPPKLREVEPAFSSLFEAILLKLLAKDPDDRYQTAAGLAADLDSFTALRAEEEPTLGRKDSLHRSLEIPLVGRKKELQSLHSAWTEAKHEKGSMILIEGEGGSGKTRLVSEILQQARLEGALVLQGKAKKDEETPVAPLRDAIQRYLQTRPDPELIRKAVGDLAPVLKRFSKTLAKFLEDTLGNIPDPPPLDPKAEQERFYESAASLFSALSKSAGSLLILLDDVQWFDQATLEIIRRLKSEIHKFPLLIAFTSRNDPESNSAKNRFIELMGQALRPPLSLEPMNLEAASELISVHLGGRQLEHRLVEKLHHQANGNPFALGEYVRLLLDEGMIVPTEKGWIYNTGQAHQLKLPTDVVQLLLNRTAKLLSGTQELLKIASVIGFEFDPQLLASVIQKNLDQISGSLNEGLQAGLLELKEKSYGFIHDRIRESLLASMTPGQLQDIHHAIAEALELKQGERSSEETYALANHYLQGHPERNLNRTYESCSQAGRLALEQGAYVQAFKYLEQAYQVSKTLGLIGKTVNPIRDLFGKAASRVGKFDLALSLAEEAESYAETLYERVDIRNAISQAYSGLGQYHKSWETCAKTLSLLGAPFPKHPVTIVLSLLKYAILNTFQRKTLLGYGTSQGDDRLRRKYISHCLLEANIDFGVTGQNLLIVYTGFRSLNNVHYLGPSSEFAKVMAIESAFQGFLGSTKKALEAAEISIGIAKQLDEPHTEFICRSYFAAGVLGSDLLLKGIEDLEQILPKLNLLPANDKMQVLTMLSFGYYVQGRLNKIVELATKYHDQARESGSHYFYLGFLQLSLAAFRILGHRRETTEFLAELEKRAPTVPNEGAHVAVLGNHIENLLDQEIFGAEMEDLLGKFSKRSSIAAKNFFTRPAYLNVAYVRLEQLRRATNQSEYQHLFKKLKKAVREVVFFPSIKNAGHAYCHYLVLLAAMEQEKRKYEKARELLNQAESFAKKTNTLWGLWAISRQRARLAQAQGNEELAKEYGREALAFAQQEGWVNRAKQARRDFGLEEVKKDPGFDSASSSHRQSLRSPSFGSSGKGTQMLGSGSLGQQRALDVLLRISLASASVLDSDKQAEISLSEATQVLGAERAFLFLNDPKTQELEFKAGRDSAGKILSQEESYCRTILRKVQSTRTSVVSSGADGAEAIGSESAVLHNLRSIVASPILMGERLVGILYLDSRVVTGLFSSEDFILLQAISNHIATSLETARAAKSELEKQALQKDLEGKQVIQTILNSLNHAVFGVNAQGVIEEPVSPYSEKIFGRSIAGQPVMEVVFSSVPRNSESHSHIKTVFEVAFGEGELQWSLVSSHLPTRLNLDNKSLRATYSPMMDRNRNLEKILFVIEDMTELLKLEAEKEKQTRVVKILQEIYALETHQLKAFFANSWKLLQEVVQLLKGRDAEAQLPLLLRNLHTIKGNARALGLSQISAVIHEVESEVAKQNLKQIQKSLDRIELSLFEYSQMATRFFKIETALTSSFYKRLKEAGSNPSEEKQLRVLLGLTGFDKADTASLEECRKWADEAEQHSLVQLESSGVLMEEVIASSLLELEKQARSVSEKELKSSPALTKLVAAIQKLREIPIQSILEEYRPMVRELATKLGKKIELKINANSVTLPADDLSFLKDILVHLIRNSVDHGVETAEVRRALKKPDTAQIEIEARVDGSGIVLLIRDDGQGLDPERITEAAIQKGIIDSAQASQLTWEQKQALIFKAGFSTKTEVTELSGRGVGMDVVKSNVEKLGGKIQLSSNPGAGTEFKIWLGAKKLDSSPSKAA